MPKYESGNFDELNNKNVFPCADSIADSKEIRSENSRITWFVAQISLAVLLSVSILTSAYAASPVATLTQAQFDKLVAQLRAIYEDRQPDVALFGESHCQVQPYQFLAADATIAMHAAAGYVAGLEHPTVSLTRSGLSRFGQA